MDYDKQPINVDEQVALLQNRGLVIEDIVTAKLQLRNISYFRIASYLRYMEEDRQFHHYKLGSTFEQAIDLYLFDKELRQLIFKAIQDIEISLRTKMIQIFSMEHGAFWFMDASLFKNADFYEGCLDNIRKRCLVQMKISSRSIPRNILSLLSLLCGKHWRSFRLVRFPNYFVCSRTIVLKSKWQESLDYLNTLTWKVG